MLYAFFVFRPTGNLSIFITKNMLFYTLEDICSCFSKPYCNPGTKKSMFVTLKKAELGWPVWSNTWDGVDGRKLSSISQPPRRTDPIRAPRLMLWEKRSTFHLGYYPNSVNFYSPFDANCGSGKWIKMSIKTWMQKAWTLSPWSTELICKKYRNKIIFFDLKLS